jgi:hypothetical protein
VQETRKELIARVRDGSELCKTIGLMDLVVRRVFTLAERRNLNLAIFDPSILTSDTSSVMHLGNLEKGKHGPGGVLSSQGGSIRKYKKSSFHLNFNGTDRKFVRTGTQKTNLSKFKPAKIKNSSGKKSILKRFKTSKKVLLR